MGRRQQSARDMFGWHRHGSERDVTSRHVTSRHFAIMVIFFE